MKLNPHTSRHSKGFTLMEILVVIAIILVLAAIAFPVWKTVQTRANREAALNNMRQLGAAAGNFSSQNDGQLPPEDAKGTDDWAAAAKPENVKTWYNSLTAILGTKTVAQYASTPQSFYSKENILWLPGAQYPDNDTKLRAPLFAIAINTKLQRKDKTDPNPNAEKPMVRLSQIAEPARTALFLEQGIDGETKAMVVQKKYDGSPKGSAKSFVARYNGYGIITFVDGHAEAVEGKDILTETGLFKFELGDIVWGRSREDVDNPNK